jgi:hypothetical protein
MKKFVPTLTGLTLFALVAVPSLSLVVTELVPTAQAGIFKKKPKAPAPEPTTSAPDGGRTPEETEEENKGRTIKICNPACTNGTYCDSHTGTCKN